MENYENLEYKILPCVALRGLVIFPNITLNFDIGRKITMNALSAALNADDEVFVTKQKDPETENPTQDDLCEIGCVAKIIQVVNIGNGHSRVIAKGIYRARMLSVIHNREMLVAKVSEINENEFGSDSYKDGLYERSLIRYAQKLFSSYAVLRTKIPPDQMAAVAEFKNPGPFADFLAANILQDAESMQ
ncbi:MAG: LON peptidase substrate-binding domain-containing protein [Acutalibacteraceae bacterium]